MKGKRLTAVLLAVCLVLTLMPAAWADAEEHSYENGICSACGFYEPAELNQAGVYEIGNAGQLYWFAALVNGDDTYAEFDAQNMSASAVLVSDIVINDGLLDENLELAVSGEDALNWTPIGDYYGTGYSAYYSGTFDGAGYEISGIYIGGTANYQGMFGRVSGGTVKDLTISDSYVSGSEDVGAVVGCTTLGAVVSDVAVKDSVVTGTGAFVGGIAGCMTSGNTGGGTTAENLSLCGSVIEGRESVGGIVGQLAGRSTLTNAYNSGTVASTSTWVGGICGALVVNGSSYGIYNCLNSGSVSNGGSICGYLSSGTITNCYYLEGLTEDSNAAAKSAEELASGEVCWLLNGSSSEDVDWYQKLGTDSYPTLDGNSVVYPASAGCDGSEIEGYTNNASGIVHVFDETGFCTCGQYQPAERNSEGVYEISNAGQLFWFAALVNGDDTYAEFDAQDMSADAVLMNDIHLESREWTPIGECFDNNGYYSGTFNGGGYTVSGLYVTGEVGDRAFFGAVAENGIVQKLTIEGSVSGITAGGIAAQNYGKIISCVNKAAVSAEIGVAGGIANSNSGEISGCYNSGELNALETGGITVYNEGTIVDCYNEGIVTDTLVRAGGIVSHNLGTISNCYNVGEVNGTNVGSIAGYNSGTIENCYYLEGLASDSNATVKSAEEFASGEVAWLLNGSTSENVVWYQTLGTDSCPVLDGESVVYLVTSACDGSEQEIYTNKATAKVHIYDETGFCADGMYEPAELNDEGIYEIGNAGQLFWFAALVNGDDTNAEIEAQDMGASAVLKNDIDLAGYEWTPIGDYGHTYYDKFSGSFDGCGYTITGLYINDSSNAGYAGLFGYVSGGTIKNLTIEDAYVKSSDRAAAIAGSVMSGSTIENCTVSAEIVVTSGESAGGIVGMANGSTVTDCTVTQGSSVTGTEAVGGIIGYASSSAVVSDSISYASVGGTSMVGGVAGYVNGATIERCGNHGSVAGGTDFTGGVAGYLYANVTVTDVYNTGSVTGDAYVGGVVGRLGNNSLTYAYNTGSVSGDTAGAVIGYIDGSRYTVNNCYYLEGCADAKVGSGSIAYSALTVKTAEAFASGEVCYLLNDSQSDNVVWYQTVGGEASPVLDSESGVVYLSTSCDGTDAGYTNIGEVVHDFDENGFCTLCGQFQPAEKNEDGAYEINNIGRFYWFAALVNGDSTHAEFDAQEDSADAVLTQDLDFEGYADYVPIGYTDLDYSSSSLDYVGYGGVFDGQGHVIRNLTITNDDTVSGLAIVGIFGTVTGTVRMLGVENFNFDRAGGSDGRFGAIAGQVIANSAGDVGRIEYCYVANSVIDGDTRISGAIAAANYGGEIESCYAYGCEVTGTTRCGNLVGDNENDTATLIGTLTRCYSTGKTVGTSNSPQTGTLVDCEASVSAERFASGEIAWLLNGETYDNAVWYQTIGEDDYPLFEGGTVYFGTSYTNDPCEALMHTFDEDGFCSVCGDYEPAEMNGEGVYEIKNAGQLFWFAALVNGDTTYAEFDAQNASADAVLMNDIDLESREWTPIGDMNSDIYYEGTFNGGGYTVSGLYVSPSAGKEGGFFSLVGENGIVKNLTVDGSVGGYIAGGITAGNFGKITDCVNNAAIDGDVSGGIVYYNYNGGEIRGCYNNGEMNAYFHAGGIAAINAGTIADCYNAGSLTAGYEAGGIVLDNFDTISNCYNVGSVSGSDVSGVVCTKYSGTIENCYYLEGTAEDSSATVKSADEFASGEVAWLLNGGQSEDVVWYQTIGTDGYPVLDDESGVVYAALDCSGLILGYANSESAVVHAGYDEDGFCTLCGQFEPAAQNGEGVYEIKNAGQLFWFAALVNGDTTHAEFDAQNASADAVLMNDIDLESREWTPIGYMYSASGYYEGTFNGGGYTVSGLYISNMYSQGFFGTVEENGIVKNLTVEGSVIGDFAGGIAAVNSGKIIGCIGNVTVTGMDIGGGLVCGNSGEICDSCNVGSVVDTDNAGGIAGQNVGTISNCYNVGEMNGTDAGSIAGYNSGTIENCYYLEGLAEDSNATVKSAEEFASGEVAWLLNGGQSKDVVWYQTIGTDKYPVLDDESGVVYAKTDCGGTAEGYANSESTDKAEHSFDEDGFCSVCGEYQPAEPNSEGVYEIKNAGQLFWFAALVNGDTTNAEFDAQNMSADAVLMNGIDLESREWTPIGECFDNGGYYSGTFDGNGYSVSGLYVTGEVGDRAFFGAVAENGIVQKLTIEGSVSGITSGGIAAQNYGKIINCVNKAAVSAEFGTAGGIVNSNSGEISGCYNSGELNALETGGITIYNKGTIVDCWNEGIVTDTLVRAGGIASYNLATISNCYNVGEVNGTDAGSIADYNSGTIENCYYLEGLAEDSSATVKSAEEFASGEVAWLLQGGGETLVWGQSLGKDSYPILSGESADRVIRITFVFTADGAQEYEYVNYGCELTDYPEGKDVEYAFYTDEGCTAQFNTGAAFVEDVTLYVAEVETTLGVTLIDGAQIRVGTGVTEDDRTGEESGLRFIAYVDTTGTLAAEASEVGIAIYDGGFGTEDKVKEIMANLTENDTPTMKIKADKYQNDTVFTAAIVNISKANYNRAYIAVPYAVVGGVTHYDFSEAVARSPYQVAAGLLVEGTTTSGYSQSASGATLTNVLNAYANETGARITLTYSEESGFGVAEAEYANGAVAYFTAECEDITDESGSVTGAKITLKAAGEDVVFYDYWKEYIRINNNNSAAVTHIENAEISDDKSTLTFEFYLQ